MYKLFIFFICQNLLNELFGMGLVFLMIIKFQFCSNLKKYLRFQISLFIFNHDFELFRFNF
jgi:hypothetical protein